MRVTLLGETTHRSKQRQRIVVKGLGLELELVDRSLAKLVQVRSILCRESIASCQRSFDVRRRSGREKPHETLIAPRESRQPRSIEARVPH